MHFPLRRSFALWARAIATGFKLTAELLTKPEEFD
jgi:hypothetical protein